MVVRIVTGNRSSPRKRGPSAGFPLAWERADVVGYAHDHMRIRSSAAHLAHRRACSRGQMRRRFQQLHRRDLARRAGAGRLKRGDRRSLRRHLDRPVGARLRSPPARHVPLQELRGIRLDARYARAHQACQGANGAPRPAAVAHRAAVRRAGDTHHGDLDHGDRQWRRRHGQAAGHPHASDAGLGLPAHRTVPRRVDRRAQDRAARRLAAARFDRRLRGRDRADAVPAVVLHQVRRRL